LGQRLFSFSKKIQKGAIKKIKKYSNFLFCVTRYSVLDDVLPTLQVTNYFTEKNFFTARTNSISPLQGEISANEYR